MPKNNLSVLSQGSTQIAILLRCLTSGGVERAMLNLTSRLAEQGLKIDLVLLEAEGVNLEQVSPKVRVVDLNTARIKGHKKLKSPTGFQSTRSLLKLIKYLRREQPTVLLSATHFPNEAAILAKHLARVPTRVVVFDFVKNPYPYMKRAAVFALSSAWEGLPTVLIEAMALQVPIVATNCPFGPAEILENGKYGVLVPVGDSEAMAQEILAAFSKKSKPVSSEWYEQFTFKNCDSELSKLPRNSLSLPLNLLI